jgi:hypothetical protein
MTGNKQRYMSRIANNEQFDAGGSRGEESTGERMSDTA